MSLTASPSPLPPPGFRAIRDAVRDENDLVLDFLTRGKVKLGLDLLRPSGVDRAAAALTREMLIRMRVEGVAFALPRGQHPLPLFL
jgi:hypothetical protein